MRAARVRRTLGAAPAALLALLLPAAVSAAAGSGAIPADPRQLRFEDLSFEVPDAAAYRHQLADGVVVYVAPDHSLPLVDVAVAVRAGAYLDPPDRPGVASLTAAMMRRGGTEALSPDAFDERADFLAADLDAGAGSLRAGASLDSTTAVFGEALDLFFDLLRHPRFDPGRLTLAKSNLLAAMARRQDDPREVLGREWSWLLYGRDHFSTRELVPSEVAAIEPADLAAFHRRWWHPGNLVVAVSGDVEPAAILAELERRFAGWEVGETAPWPPPAPSHVPHPGLYHLERDLPQAKVLLGHLGARRRGWDDPDFYGLAVLNEVLGGQGAGARIAGRLRTVEGLAYQVGATFGVGDFWPGELRISVETANGNVARAVALVREELGRLRARAPGADELALAKRSVTDVFPLLFDTAEEVAGYFAEDEFLGRPHSFWRDYRRRIEAVTAEQVRALAAEFLHPDQLVVVTVGRWREIEGGEGGGAAGGLGDGGVFFLPRRDPLTLEPIR